MTLKNKQFANGRIHASVNPEDTYETGYVAYTASPFDPKFYKDIEGGVQYHLQELILKGYLPISSCEGHYHKKQNMNTNFLFSAKYRLKEKGVSYYDIESIDI